MRVGPGYEISHTSVGRIDAHCSRGGSPFAAAIGEGGFGALLGREGVGIHRYADRQAQKKGRVSVAGQCVHVGPRGHGGQPDGAAGVRRNGILIGATTVSTGRPGHLTPTGVFTVLQKQKEHRSTIYDGAPMPHMERLTWGGIALHAGGLPGYPESHGCVHLPSEFAKLLFDISPAGMTVVIASDATAPES